MRSLVCVAIASDQPVIEWILKQPINHAPTDFLAACPLELLRLKAPVIAGYPVDLRDGIRAGKQHIPHLSDQPKPFWIFHDCLVFYIVQVSHGRDARKPAFFELRFVSTPYVLAQAVNVILRLAEDQVKHELSLGVVLETVRRKFQLFQLACIEQINNFPAVNGISSKPIRMPGNDPVSFSFLDPLDHFVENRPSRLLRALRFTLDIFHDFQFLSLDKTIQLFLLGFQG